MHYLMNDNMCEKVCRATMKYIFPTVVYKDKLMILSCFRNVIEAQRMNNARKLLDFRY